MRNTIIEYARQRRFAEEGTEQTLRDWLIARKLEAASCKRISLEECDLKFSDFSSLDFSQSSFARANVYGVKFCHTILEDVDISSVQGLIWAQLVEAQFTQMITDESTFPIYAAAVRVKLSRLIDLEQSEGDEVKVKRFIAVCMSDEQKKEQLIAAVIERLLRDRTIDVAKTNLTIKSGRDIILHVGSQGVDRDGSDIDGISEDDEQTSRQRLTP